MSEALKWLLFGLGILQAVSLCTFAIDKVFSMRSDTRISEYRLNQWCFLGPVGAIVGMLLFRHKIRKWSFLLRAIPWIAVGLFVQGYAIYFLM